MCRLSLSALSGIMRWFGLSVHSEEGSSDGAHDLDYLDGVVLFLGAEPVGREDSTIRQLRGREQSAFYKKGLVSPLRYDQRIERQPVRFRENRPWTEVKRLVSQSQEVFWMTHWANRDGWPTIGFRVRGSGRFRLIPDVSDEAFPHLAAHQSAYLIRLPWSPPLLARDH